MTRVGLVCVTILLAGLAACGDNDDECASWRQWGNSASHDGASCVIGQSLGSAALADLVLDPFVAAGRGRRRRRSVVHYQAPLVDGDDVYMMAKSGTYTPCDTDQTGHARLLRRDQYRLNTQVWREKGYAWQPDGSLAMTWSFDSDWKPEPSVQFEPMFQPALAARHGRGARRRRRDSGSCRATMAASCVTSSRSVR